MNPKLQLHHEVARPAHVAPSLAAMDLSILTVLTETLEILGKPLVAAVLGQDAARIDEWLTGAPLSDCESYALRTTLHVSRTINLRLPQSIVRRWFISPADELANRSPLEALAVIAADGSTDLRARVVLAADRYWKVR